MIATILVTVSTVLGYLTAYFLDKKKHKVMFRVTIITMGVLTLSTIWIDHSRQEKESKSTQDRFDRIIKQNDFLKAQIDKVRDQNDSLSTQIDQVSEKLEPFMRIARANYPALGDDEALVRLATDISHISQTLEHMQPKLIYLPDKTKSWKDNNTNQIHTTYYFRSQYSVSLRDISIKMRFNKTVVRAEGKVTGAFVVEQSSKMLIDPDSKGLTFVTGYLGVGNDIMIEVITNELAEITSMDISP